MLEILYTISTKTNTRKVATMVSVYDVNGKQKIDETIEHMLNESYATVRVGDVYNASELVIQNDSGNGDEFNDFDDYNSYLRLTKKTPILEYDGQRFYGVQLEYIHVSEYDVEELKVGDVEIFVSYDDCWIPVFKAPEAVQKLILENLQ